MIFESLIGACLVLSFDRLFWQKCKYLPTFAIHSQYGRNQSAGVGLVKSNHPKKKEDTMANVPANDSRKKVWDLIKDIKYAMMVTVGEDGRLFSRPMVAHKPDKHECLWFFTSADSPKVREIMARPDVLLSYAEPGDNNYVSVSGEAVIVRDQAKINEFWSESLKAWFPKGKDDPNLALICVTPKSAEYWDGPSSAFVQAFGYMKARVTGEPERMGENRIVHL
jgi:general stress protein 26